MQRPIYTFIMVFFYLSFCTPPSLNAQEEIPIFVNTPFCDDDDCVYAFAETGFPPGAQFLWLFTDGISQPSGDTLAYITTETPYVTWCGATTGSFLLRLEVVVDSSIGGIILIGQTYFDVYLTYFSAQGAILYETACDVDTFSVFYPDGNLDCFDVCVGSTSNLRITDLINLYGQTILLDNQYWMINGQLASLPGRDVSILWEEEGTGSAVFSGWFISDADCENFYELDLCFNILPPPIAEITTQPPLNSNGILEVCEGQSIFFFSETDDVDTYLWDFGDGSGASIQNPTHTFTAAGSYDVQLITNTDCACSDTTTVTVIVEGNDAPFIDCVSTICEGTSVTYTANTNCNSYAWDISDNGTVLNGGSITDDFITIEWGNGPIGEITLETDGCPDLSACTAAAYMQIPIVSANSTIDGPDRVCQGERTIYSLPPFEGVAFNWTVSAFGTIIDGQGTQSVTIEWYDGPIPAAAQLVNVDYNNCYLGCDGSASLPVFIRPEYSVSGDIEVCENTLSDYAVINTQTNIGFPALFHIVDQAGTVVWTGGAAASMAMIDWDFGAGDFTLVTLPQNAGDFCTQSYNFPVKVIPQPIAPTGITGQNEICPGITYTYQVDNPVSGERYRWLITNGSSISERDGLSIAVNWGNTGPYTVSLSRLTPPLFCASPSIDFTVNTISNLSISGETDICLDQIADYSSNQTGDVYYEWSIVPANAGTIITAPDDAIIEVLWHNAGMATVVLDICGQQESFVVDVRAPPQPTVNAPTALCAGTTAMVNTVQPYSSYAWQNAEGLEISTDATPNLGGGYYRLEVTDDIGCTGSTTFYIYPYPESTISISTPDYNIFCNIPPSTRMYAINSDDSYIFQWYQNGAAIAGETISSYTATAFGVYYVEIVDENGCYFTSNSISVAENCGDIGGSGGGAGCNNNDHNFSLTTDGSCDNRAYTANAVGSIPGTTFWWFDDPASGVDNTAVGNNATHQFTKPGFYRVLMGAMYPDGAGGEVLCRSIQPDTIYAVAQFDYEGVCSGSPVQFYDLSTFIPDLTNLTDWSWDFGDPASGVANISTDKDALHIFTGEGTYQVTLTVTTTTGCTASITRAVLIYPLPTTNFEDPADNCAATALAFEADVEATVSSLVWDFGEPGSGNANTSTLFNSYHAYANAGNYTINLEATSVYGCVNNFSNSIAVTANGLNGEITPEGLSVLCEGDSITLTAPMGVGVEWEWSTTEQSQSITVSEAAGYEVTLTDAEGCTYTPALAVIDIIPAPLSPIRAVTYNELNPLGSYTYDTLFICEGEEVFLETAQQAAYTYSWSSGDIDNTTEFSELRGNILTAGEHIISLTITENTTACSATEVFVIQVNPTPDQPLITTGGGALCAGTNIGISISNPDASLSYIWSNGDTGPTITTDEAGHYIVTAFNAFGCSSKSEAIEILEGPDISLVPSGCHTRCAPDTLCMPQIPNIVSYQWYQDGMLIPAPEGTIVDLIIMETGVYTLEMEDVNGCTQTSNPLTIDILPGYGTILGNIYFDLNDNAIIDAADSLGSGIAINLSSPSEAGTIISNESGNYGFIDIPEGNYTLSIDTLSVPVGWMPQISSIDTSFIGCDQEITINWLLIPFCFDTTFVAAVCPGEDFIFLGQPYAIGSNQTVQSPGALICDSTFTFSVQALPTSTELLEADICFGETYNYNGQNYPAGTNTPIQYINSMGCDSIVQLIVTTTPEATLELSTEESCPNLANGSLLLTPIAGSVPFVYALNDGDLQSTPQFDNLEAGTYDLYYEDNNGCRYTETFIIDAMPSLLVELQDITLPCEQPSALLQPQVYSGDDGQLQFTWSDGVNTRDRTVNTPGSLVLEVSNSCEEQRLSVEVTPEIKDEELMIYVPNAFSPNDDGTNDIFKVFPNLDAQVEEFEFKIFDRWGAVIFSTTSPADGWEGFIRTQKADTGVYVWYMRAKVSLCGQQTNLAQEGDLLLVR